MALSRPCSCKSGVDDSTPDLYSERRSNAHPLPPPSTPRPCVPAGARLQSYSGAVPWRPGGSKVPQAYEVVEAAGFMMASPS
ncbi:hypothetical protein E2562_004877 [Oryza meyeriana var. granulata]|uniref:Uncharacterized protein n=1 Tax=Oryza meyeriana var. granulata TaxID=110450 RepID=A0A6G1C3R1_9ORYZ|nr:hypothetical protein E2562_004877 [Oryza meyeriana var. granulata]